MLSISAEWPNKLAGSVLSHRQLSASRFIQMSVGILTLSDQQG